MPGHYIVLRHQDGEDWDYAVIEHLGTKASVDAAGNPRSRPAACDRLMVLCGCMGLQTTPPECNEDVDSDRLILASVHRQEDQVRVFASIM